MNTGTLYDALSCIDAGFIDAANDCAAVKAAFRKQKTAAVRRTVIPLTCVCAVALAAAVVWKSGLLTNPKPIDNNQPSAADTTVSPPADTTVPPANNGADSAEPTVNEPTVPAADNERRNTDPARDHCYEGGTTSPDGGNYGGPSGGVGYFAVPALPFDPTTGERLTEIVTTGEPLTDEEAAAYFAQNGAHLTTSLAASGVPTDKLRISEKGYGHVSYSGVEGERLEWRQNFRDYLVYNGDELVAIVTLVKENGQIYDTPAFGAPWFSTYAQILNEHRGEELVYVYAGIAELILAPDGSAYAPIGPGVRPEIYLEGVDDPYHLFYTPGAVYVP